MQQNSSEGHPFLEVGTWYWVADNVSSLIDEDNHGLFQTMHN